MFAGNSAALVRKIPLKMDLEVQTPAAYLPQKGGHLVYITQAAYTGSQVLSACSSGFHPASFWEIMDVTNLVYDKNHPAAHTAGDSGYGPPSYWYGWVRTGEIGASPNTAGSGNCQNWTSSNAASYGAAVRLTRTWESPPAEIKPWDAVSFSCNTLGPVWCVGDFSVLYVPLMR